MPVTIIEPDKPETEITFTDEQIAAARQAWLDDFRRENPNEKINRHNSLFMKAELAVKTLDERGFAWGKELASDVKTWACIWIARAIVSPRRKRWPKFQPMFVEVF